MCYQVIEVYTICKCVYYQHAVDKCAAHDRPGHSVTKHTVLVGYACSNHADSFDDGDQSSDPSRSASTSDSGYASLPSAKLSRKQLEFNSTARFEDFDEDGNAIPYRSSRTAGYKIGTYNGSLMKQKSATSRRLLDIVQRFGPLSSLDKPNPIEPSSFSPGSEQEFVERSRPFVWRTAPSASEETASLWTSLDGKKYVSLFDSFSDSRHSQIRRDKDSSTPTTPAEYGIESSDGIATQPEQYHNLVELLVGYLADDSILKHLWPQLILRLGSIETAYQKIKHLLLIYSLNLQNLAEALNAKDPRGSKLRVIAANAIDGRSFAVSAGICLIFWSPDLGSESLRNFEDLASRSGSFGSWGVRESEFLKDFLFRTNPLCILRENVRVLVEQPLPLPPHIRVIDAARRWYESTYCLMVAPDLQPGRQRLVYTCRCGHKLYDDYDEIRSGALDEFKLLLQQNRFKVTNSGDLESNKPLGPLTTCSGTTKSATASNETRDIRLPVYWQKQDQSKLGECAGSISQTQNEERHNYVLTCVPFGRLVYKVQQPEVCTIKSDQDFFSLLRVTYRQNRTRTPLSLLRRVRAINFVQFDLYRTQFADVRSHPTLPPDGDQYMYDPMPTDILPPIGSNLLVHFLENPTHAGALPDLYKRIPKKLRDRLSPCPQEGRSVGWGLALTEGIDPFVFFLCGCVGFLICLLAAVAWTIGKGDVQGGFGIGAFLLSFTLFCGGLVHSSVTARGLSTS